MSLRLLASSFTAPGADLRWDDEFLRAERSRLGLGRRTDRMTAAVLSAFDRLEGRPGDAPLVFGSMLGVQSRITALQNDLIDFPEDQIGPVSFSCSVHNAVPGAAAIRFGMKVPVFSLAGFDRLHERAFRLADAILSAGDAEHAIVILTEERSPFAERAMKLSGLEPMEFAAVFLLEHAGADDPCAWPGPPPDLSYFRWIGSLLSN
ncbi:MAG: beta-ketoacyl synthase chain length factor [Lentisphaeria bacterium]|nr:beta-ketoacyl synthase chain length factor [Lentisphaeria bacterium]